MTLDPARLLAEATPGPWHYQQSEGCDPDTGPYWDGGFDILMPVADGDPGTMDRAAFSLGGSGWGEPEAALIAAAPDLAARCLALERALAASVASLREKAALSADRDICIILGETADDLERAARRET